MNILDYLPKTQRIHPILDQEINSFVCDFNKQNYSVNYRLDEKDQLIKNLKTKLKNYLKNIIDLSDFNFMYPLNGITEGLTNLGLEYKNQKIKIFNGDYEWLKLCSNDNISTSRGDILYISNPSSINGNYLNNWNDILEEHKNIALDCAYLGSVDIKHIKYKENINYVYVGLSKMFGLSELRIGYVFTKSPNIPLGTLLRNNYFNLNNIKITNELIENFSLDYIYKKYRNKQIKICSENNLIPSDVVYIATSSDEKYKFWKRDKTNRLCITNLLI